MDGERNKISERNKILMKHLGAGPNAPNVPNAPNALHGSSILLQCVSWYAEDDDCEDDEDCENEDCEDRAGGKKVYTIRAFGVTEARVDNSVHLVIRGFQPYFYVRGDSPTCFKNYQTVASVKRWLLEDVGSYLDVVDASVVVKTDFWGFQNEAPSWVLKLQFLSLKSMRVMASIISKHINDRSVPRHIGCTKLVLYESNIDPILRFFHTLSIQPSGWIRVKAPREIGRHAIVVDEWDRGGITPVPSKAEDMAPILIASFDLECDSLHGDFPVPIKDYRRLALDIEQLMETGVAGRCGPLKDVLGEYDVKNTLIECIMSAFFPDQYPGHGALAGQAGQLAHSLALNRCPVRDDIFPVVCRITDDIYAILRPKTPNLVDKSRDRTDRILTVLNNAFLPKLPLSGDPIIQIGVTVNLSGQRTACAKYVFVLGSCADAADDIEVMAFEREADLIVAWCRFMKSLDPDIVTGYNIFGFDFDYLYQRAEALGVLADIGRNLTRIPDVPSTLVVRELSSSALGDNILKFIDMPGRVLIDLMKVVQRDHRLDSYKLDAVARHFTGAAKDDVSPKDIFRLQKGSPEDRAIIARYCVQDCVLCNELVAKLEILANNMGMANVCSVPLSHIFMRGQGVKIFSLVAKQCMEDGYIIPTRKYMGPGPGAGADDHGYEGAIVLEPETGMYLDTPVSVLDYNSLYPSSMISENISHDTLVLDPAYANLPGIEYVDITFDKYATVDGDRVVVGRESCRFAQTEGKGILPRILQSLLSQRKNTRKRIGYVRYVRYSCTTGPESGPESGPDSDQIVGVLSSDRSCIEMPDGSVFRIPSTEGSKSPPRIVPAYTEFQRAVLDGLQLAYKTTANSLYGQMGARTSPTYLREIAACTTAVGRSMISKAKEFIEEKFCGRVIYGDTDSLFVVFPPPSDPHESSANPQGPSANPNDPVSRLSHSISMGQAVSRAIKPLLKAPHNLEYEKTMFPLILLSKKRYVGLLYEDDPHAVPKQKSMGIALKRRDYAPIVKRVYGGVIDIILKEKDIPKAVSFMESCLRELADGNAALDELVISKTLKSHYKFPKQIAHWVLARRMFERDPGSAPQVNDRIPYVFVECPTKNALMGERIEHIDYVRSNHARIASGDRSVKKVRIDSGMYIETQLMKPCTQILAIALEQLPGYKYNAAVSGKDALQTILATKNGDTSKALERLNTLREREVEKLLFVPVLDRIAKKRSGQMNITSFFKPKIQDLR